MTPLNPNGNQCQRNPLFEVRNLRYPGNSWYVLAQSAEEAKAVVIACERGLDFALLTAEEVKK